MKNVDVEIYINQIISFFEKNPNDLIDLIGELDKDSFYERVKEQCYKNLDKGDEISLTQQQLIDIVYNLKKGNKVNKDILTAIVQNTRFGPIFLN
jgi:hypothetical protein